ncbi:MAG: FkbM family methyltransferase [Novosphingobium sp.]|nr:FkbM family methyltransferase [Novosphingobium sp.]
MTFISYAQNLEDVILWRALGHCSPGRYVDVGAQDPLVDSVARAFHEAGWSGVHVEPLADYAAALRDAFPTDTVIEAAVSKKVGSLPFYELPGGGLSTVRADIAQFHKDHAGHSPVVRQVATTTLAKIFKNLGKGSIHWLKIDVEGHEREVLEGWGNAPQRPWVVVVESTFPTTDVPTHEMWEDLLVARDYGLVYTDGLNRFYLHADHQDLRDKFRYPPNVFDRFELNGTATWLTSRLVREHEKAISAQQGRIEQLDGLLVRATQERGETEALLQGLRRQNQLERKNHASELERLRSAGKVSEAMERLARDLEGELHTLRASMNDAQAHRLAALEAAEVAHAAERIARTEMAAAQADAAQSADHAEAAARDLARMQERADKLAGELEEHLSNADLLSRQIDQQASRIDQLEDQLRQQTDKTLARTQALNQAESEATQLARELQEQLSNADLLSQQIDQQASRIDQLEDQLRQQAHKTLERTYALQRAESKADAARAAAAQIGEELAHRLAAIERLEKLVSAAGGEAEKLIKKLNGSFGAQLLSRIGLLRIDTSRAAWLAQQAKLSIEHLDEKSWQPASSEHERERTAMSIMPANDVNELLMVNGAEFVEVAYRTLLQRSPDRAGSEHFLERLRAGHGKEAIILAIANSPEARALPNTLPGLGELLARDANRRKSRGSRTEIARLERTINRLEFSLGEMHAGVARQSNRILERLDLLESKVAAFSASGVAPRATPASGSEAKNAMPPVPQPISSLINQVIEATPERFIDQLRYAVRQSAEAATISVSTH